MTNYIRIFIIIKMVNYTCWYNWYSWGNWNDNLFIKKISPIKNPHISARVV